MSPSPTTGTAPAAAETLIAVDWGGSNLRAWRLSARGETLAEHRSEQGMLRVPADGGPAAHASVLRGAIGPWLQAGSRVLMAGMVGSRQGWIEAPYARAPAGAAELAAALTPVPFDVPCWVVPGVALHGCGAPDVMRGEETQLVGLPGDADGSGLAILPGTHSKWVWREAGRIVWFRTFMTGELFDLLGRHSLLGRTMQGEAVEAASFAQGLAAAGQPGGLLEKLFAVRARWLFGELAAGAQRGYLSGLLIGSECADALAALAREVAPPAASGRRAHLVASAGLAGLYLQALRAHDITVQSVDDSASARGLLRIARAAGVMPAMAG